MFNDYAGPFPVYCAHSGSESGRGNGALISVCSSKSNAQAAAFGKGYWGGDGDVVDRKAVRLDDKVYLLDEDYSEPIDLDNQQAKIKERIRQEALSKLTDVEKEALGLKSP